MDVNFVVQSTLKKYKTRSPYELADIMNIEIHKHDLGSILGYYYKAYRTKHIVLSNSLLPGGPEEKYVLSHELGHSVMHPDANTPFLRANTYLAIDKMEIEANKFSMLYLISDEEIEDYVFERQYTSEMLFRLWGYKKELIELRIKNYDWRKKL